MRKIFDELKAELEISNAKIDSILKDIDKTMIDIVKDMDIAKELLAKIKEIAKGVEENGKHNQNR